ncbi:uncharacterized protein MELLADRAFT_112002 [Melampsora larici-populina 98AG31]|uniref:Uncharacterized protein n=1 Tax=Melampsora larici-populina (strain 98AG31 / pathotype 3-4-7) TaxID=747676 RepID=F4S525_MELLP|nr:uncharacterized protein MELLADRAFT_112002 [Melampsora larici-populina 98AG31]EGG00279.1 hypothetical protein MELLADRAFT_112002 [Melampsora larici-populina 98AG31]
MKKKPGVKGIKESTFATGKYLSFFDAVKAITGNAFGSLRMKDWSRNQNEIFKKIDGFGRVGIVETLTRSELCEIYGLKAPLACCLDTVSCGLENEYAHMNAEAVTLIDTLNAKICKIYTFSLPLEPLN